MDGSGRISLHNRRHLKVLHVNKPHTPIIMHQSSVDNLPNKLNTNVGSEFGLNIQKNISNKESILNVPDQIPDQIQCSSSSSTEAPLLRRSKRTRKVPIRFSEYSLS